MSEAFRRKALGSERKCGVVFICGATLGVALGYRRGGMRFGLDEDAEG
jgi:hypothetical protein